MFQELIDSNWEILDILLVAVGLVIVAILVTSACTLAAVNR